MPGDVEMACTPCAPQEPGERLLSACEKRDLPGFLAALTDVAVDDPHCVTCLHRAAADPTFVEYLKRLLSAGVDPNTLDHRRKSPLQIAAEKNNADALQVILRDKRTDVAVLDQSGNTALHLVTQGQGNPDVQARCITLLLAHHQMDANKKNRKGHSTVLLAAKKCPLLVVQVLLKHPNIDLDHAKFLDGSTARTLIETNFKVLGGQLPPPLGEDKTSTADDLMRLLYARQDQATRKFCELVKEGVHGDVNHHDGKDTLLQRACADGLLEAASALLAQGADPNKTCPGVKVSRPPLLLACAAGHADVAQLLLDDDRTRVSARTEEGDTALIQLIRSWDGLQGGYQKCLRMLLDHHDIDINASNERGETALHYASVTGDRGLVLDLLKVGAYIGGANSLNRLPLTNIPRDVMETHLNDCLTNHQSHFSENYRIEFDYSFLVPPGRKMESLKLLDSKAKDCEIGDSEDVQEDLSSHPETEPLLYMSRKPDLRPLLKHPVLTSFMELKWRRLALLFRLNIIFYILFVAFITVHILWGNGRNKAGATNATADDTALASHPGNPGFECLQWIPLVNGSLEEDRSSPEVDRGPPDPSDARVVFNDSVQIVAIILLVIFALRELFQFLVSPKRYFSWTNKENYFEILLLISTSLILFRNDLQPYFSAITILLSWGELVLLVGRHPMLSTYIEMLKTVSWNFLKFLAWYAILIVAFALSFYTLFRDSDDADNFFADPGLSVFKTVVMLTGEFDASDIPFVEFPIVSHAVFVLFVFLIAIVLFNLLNGLAVSDTQAIKDDAELVGYVSRVKLVAYIERMVLGNGKRSTWWPSLLRWPVLARRVTLFSDTVNVAGHVLPNQGAALWVGPRGEKRDSPPGDACSLHCDVIKAAEDVLATKDRPTDMEQIRRSLEVTEARLADMESHFRGVEKLLQELLNNATDRPTEQ